MARPESDWTQGRVARVAPPLLVRQRRPELLCQGAREVPMSTEIVAASGRV